MSDFIIQQGTDASYSWQVQNDDGSVFDSMGWHARLQVKSVYGNVLAEFSTDDGNIVFSNGELIVFWNADQSKTWNWSGGRYDLLLWNDQETVRGDSGYITISKAVTTK